MFPEKSDYYKVQVQRKLFPLKLAFAITLHNSQGSTLEYMKADFDLEFTNS